MTTPHRDVQKCIAFLLYHPRSLDLETKSGKVQKYEEGPHGCCKRPPCHTVNLDLHDASPPRVTQTSCRLAFSHAELLGLLEESNSKLYFVLDAMIKHSGHCSKIPTQS